jgi:hypothetical protein
MVEQVVARWERQTMVVVITQGEILGTENMIKMKIGKNEKMDLGERIDANLFFFFLSQM